MATSDKDALGTEDLEQGMRAGRARHVAKIGCVLLVLLALINSGGLAQWTQSLPPSARNSWIAERAAEWDRFARALGPAQLFEQVRDAYGFNRN